jgi:Pyruvate/2-oxoacid:ferredoxin oxidoreductase gamma subunit
VTLTKELEPDVQELERVTIRFAGDSGDGMQLTGTQFTRTAAVFGNDISTLPDFPAEIRAPAGSLPGVSGFQISFSSSEIHTPGDQPDVLVAMNPAALKTNIGDLPPGGALIVNSDAFTQQNLNKAAYASNPLTDGSLKAYTVFEVPISTLNTASLQGLDMTSKQMDLTKNFFALGLMFWLYERSMEPTVRWIDSKFGARPIIAEANKRALHAGYAFLVFLTVASIVLRHGGRFRWPLVAAAFMYPLLQSLAVVYTGNHYVVDIAIGFGRLLGFRVPENFKHPFTATTLTQFWPNWHVTLTDWQRENVFLPLGGMRARGWRLWAIVLGAMLIVGVWHAFTPIFILWGLYHGTLLLVEHWLGIKPLHSHRTARWRLWLRYGLVQVAVMGGMFAFIGTDLGIR